MPQLSVLVSEALSLTNHISDLLNCPSSVFLAHYFHFSFAASFDSWLPTLPHSTALTVPIFLALGATSYRSRRQSLQQWHCLQCLCDCTYVLLPACGVTNEMIHHMQVMWLGLFCSPYVFINLLCNSILGLFIMHTCSTTVPAESSIYIYIYKHIYYDRITCHA